MRSNMMNKRASVAATEPAIETWTAMKQADWMGDMIRQTIQWLTTHKDDPKVEEKAKALPIASRVGPNALQGPINKYMSSGNASELSSDLELLLEKKRSTASRKEATPSPWEVDNRRSLPETGCCDEPSADNSKKTPSGTPSSWAVDTKRTLPNNPDSLTLEDQMEAKKKASLSLFEPEDDEEIKLIASVSQPWVARRLATGIMRDGKPRFILAGDEAVAVVNQHGEVFDGGSKPTNKYDHVLSEKPGLADSLEDMAQKVSNKTASELYYPESVEEIMQLSKGTTWDLIKKEWATKYFGNVAFVMGDDGQPRSAVNLQTGDVLDRNNKIIGNTKKSNKTAATEGGAEEQSEQQTTIDSAVVSLLEACKNEWNSLGEPVNPGTWPKEIERAILALNDGLVAEIQKIQDKLVEGEFYSKNVDEGVSGGSNSLMTSLNIAEAEPEAPVEESPDMHHEAGFFDWFSSEPETVGTAPNHSCKNCGRDTRLNKGETTCDGCGTALPGGVTRQKPQSAPSLLKKNPPTEDVRLPGLNKRKVLEEQGRFNVKEAAADIPDTRKAIKHTQSLKDEIASKFFEFKKVVQNASDSALVKNVGENLVGLKQNLDEVEKMLTKQLTALEQAEEAVEAKAKDMKKESKKAAAGECPECQGKTNCTCEEENSNSTQPVNPQPQTPSGSTPVKPKTQPNSPVKQYGVLSSLNLASTATK